VEQGESAGTVNASSPETPARGTDSPWKLWTERVLRWGLGVIFVYAAYSKILDAPSFAEEISYYHMLPMQQVNWMAIFLPWLELVCGICLLTGFSWRGAMWLVIAMLIMFTYAIGHAVHEGRDIRCGCFGHGESAERVGYVAIGRDLVMIATAVVALFLRRSRN